MPGRFSRRRFIQGAASVAGAATLAGTGLASITEAASPRDQRTLNIMCWAGYTDPSFVKPFEKMFNCKVQSIYPNSSDEFFAKWMAGGGKTYDLASASGDVTRRFIRSNTLLEIDAGTIAKS